MNFGDAEIFCEKSLSMWRECYGDRDHRAVGNVLNNKARLRQKQVSSYCDQTVVRYDTQFCCGGSFDIKIRIRSVSIGNH